MPILIPNTGERVYSSRAEVRRYALCRSRLEGCSSSDFRPKKLAELKDLRVVRAIQILHSPFVRNSMYETHSNQQRYPLTLQGRENEVPSMARHPEGLDR
jgi:hypothetical protein